MNITFMTQNSMSVQLCSSIHSLTFPNVYIYGYVAPKTSLFKIN